MTCNVVSPDLPPPQHISKEEQLGDVILIQIDIKLTIVWCGLWCLTHFQQYFSYIMAVSFIGGRN